MLSYDMLEGIDMSNALKNYTTEAVTAMFWAVDDMSRLGFMNKDNAVILQAEAMQELDSRNTSSTAKGL